MSTSSGYESVGLKGGIQGDIESTEKLTAFQKIMLIPIFNPQSRVFRYTILVFVCFLTFGSYFCYDNPGAMQTGFQDTFGINKFEYETLYSVYSWPNTFLVFFGGYLIDRWFGLRFGAFLFCSFILLGQIIFSAGTTVGGMPGYGIAVFGRFVFGLGGESLAVAQSTYTAKWLKQELAMAFGITLSFSRIGSAVNFNVEPTIESSTNISVAVWFGAGLCLLSLISALILAFFDKRGEKAKELLKKEEDDEDEEVKAEEPVRLTDVLYFPLSMWFIYCICVTFYVAVFIFITIASNYFVDKYGYSTSFSGRIVSIPYLVSAIASPLLGFMVDHVGYGCVWICISCAMLCLVHLSIAMFNFTPIPAMVVMGLVYSLLAASLWPSVALVIDMSRLGTAYGLMTALQNLGLAIAPLVVGQLVDQYGDKTAIFIFAGCALCAFFLSLCLLVTDWFAGRPINSSSKTIKKRMHEAEAKAEVVDDDIGTAILPSFEEELIETTTESLLKPRTHVKIRHAYLYKVGIAGQRPPSQFS